MASHFQEREIPQIYKPFQLSRFMFKFLKEKLKSWFKSSAKEAEKAEIIEKPVEKKPEKKEEVKEIEPTEKIKIKEAEEKVKEKEKALEKKKSFFERIGLIRKYKISEEHFSEIFENLELVLLENNVALEVVDYLKENLKKELLNLEIDKKKIEETIKQALRISIESLFTQTPNLIENIKSKPGTFIIVFFGINGGGKTTTIAKLAYFLKARGISSVMAASDTFRAASIEQLVKHGEKLGINVIKQGYGADPAAVAFDAIEYARAHKIKAVLIDTAGRMHTKENLMKEMAKIIRVSKPDLKLFIAESTLGNDAIEQAKTFNESIGIDGIILTKADVDEKGGTALSVSYITGKPILFLGTGQSLDSLKVFNKEKLIKDLGL